MDSFLRVLRVQWRVHEVRDVGSVCGCASADHAINVRIARRLLKSLSIKQGRKYNDPESDRDIIEFHHLDVNEILDPIDAFSKYPSCQLLVLV